jgi:aspartyl-tRNA(Asn)/glutamyl-tRNA(Gln) amidotransferase subunit B
VVTDDFVEGIRRSLPMLPAARRARYESELALPAADARVLTEHPRLSDYFEALVAQTGDAKRAANWVCNVLKPAITTDGLDATFPVTVAQLAGVFARLDDGTVSGKLARDVYAQMAGTHDDADAVIDRNGWRVVSDAGAIEAACRAVLDANPKQVAQYRAGKKNLAGFFKGAVMKATGGRADPRALDAVLTRLLEEGS